MSGDTLELYKCIELMNKIAYWKSRYDWPQVRNIYAAIMRVLETGKEMWKYDLHDYKDMLYIPQRGLNVVDTSQNKHHTQDMVLCSLPEGRVYTRCTAHDKGRS